ncbi:hypothetical protein BGZ60DRAFT_533599 [Tricladium varicosporioides]|nr:hypothetical protein BGZ60DRAFT_533599 [Hymenoscyphus varicosporioides]
MPPKPVQPPRKPNPLRNKREINATTVFSQKEVQDHIQRNLASHAARKKALTCGDATCPGPIEDGICKGCGQIIEESNIVAEVQFGESSSGAAVVQGSFLGADQGTARSIGPAFRRAGGDSNTREHTVREGKKHIASMAAFLRLNQTCVDQATQILKIAAINNFIQGRRMDVVCAVALYSAARQQKQCGVMLIDFADKISVNVFKLGRTFKALHKAVHFAREGLRPVICEDLIWRFASKLDFGDDTDKVAEDAVRMVQRMGKDWITVGRRPSGVCGACLILAARMNNYRRTVTEVVYIVKVTTHTIQKRLEEFKYTPSSALTIEEFINNEFLETAQDPPSFYEQTEEFQKNKKRRRRRRGHDGLDIMEDENNEQNAEGIVENGPNKRQKTGSTTSDVVPTVELRRDADGFAIPPTPAQTQLSEPAAPQQEDTEEPEDITPTMDMPASLIDPDLVDVVLADKTNTSMEKLIEAFGGRRPLAGDEELATEVNEEQGTTSPSKPRLKGRPPQRQVVVPQEWESAEQELSSQISEMIADPTTVDHAVSYARAQQRAAEHMLRIADHTKAINMDVNIGEDEFENDPDVRDSILSPDQAAIREQIWVNENKVWLRNQQIKAYKKKLEERGPPKAKRNRKRKPRIGEGQTEPASSPGAAIAATMKLRKFSKKINYDAISNLVDDLGTSSALGSATTSRMTSRAGSEAGLGSESSRAGSVAGSSRAATPVAIIMDTPVDDAPLNEEDISDAEGDYVSPEPASQPTQRHSEPQVEEDDTNDHHIDDDEDFPDDESYDAGFNDDGPPDIDDESFPGEEDIEDYD